MDKPIWKGFIQPDKTFPDRLMLINRMYYMYITCATIEEREEKVDMTNNYRFDDFELLLRQCATMAAGGTRYDASEIIDSINGGTGDWQRSHEEEFYEADDSEKLEMCFEACYEAIEEFINSEMDSDLIGRRYEDWDGKWLIVDSDGQNVTIKSTSHYEESWQSPMSVSANEAMYFITHDYNTDELKSWYEDEWNEWCAEHPQEGE